MQVETSKRYAKYDRRIAKLEHENSDLKADSQAKFFEIMELKQEVARL
jgi:predicted RNase H-like nuclease (RuvC/YqgF family)